MCTLPHLPTSMNKSCPKRVKGWDVPIQESFYFHTACHNVNSTRRSAEAEASTSSNTPALPSGRQNYLGIFWCKLMQLALQLSPLKEISIAETLLFAIHYSATLFGAHTARTICMLPFGNINMPQNFEQYCWDKWQIQYKFHTDITDEHFSRRVIHLQ